jgi:hypothetical protein
VIEQFFESGSDLGDERTEMDDTQRRADVGHGLFHYNPIISLISTRIHSFRFDSHQTIA